MRSDDFGEPIKEREEVELDEDAEISPVTEPADTQHYGVPDDEPISEPELDIDSIETVVPVTTEKSSHYSRTSTLFTDDALFDDDIDSIMS